jgi:uncharacterized coiled-coil protein SlyX
MSRRAGHARPRGRAALQAAYSQLQVDLAQIRWAAHEDHLESLRLGSLAEGLTEHMARMASDLSALRHELAEARTAPQQADPNIAGLAAELAGLRATIASQRELVADLVERVQHAQAVAVAAQQSAAEQVAAAEAAARAAIERAARPAPAPAPAPVPSTSPEPVPAAFAPVAAPGISTAPHEPAASERFAPPTVVDLAEPREGREPEPALAAVSALAASAVTRPQLQKAPVETVDDESLRRLHLIREAESS